MIPEERIEFEPQREPVNRCLADRERRVRAMNDSELIQRVGNLERRIAFNVGYDHRAFPEDCGGGGHGQHGMTLRFTLVGPKGAVAWSAALSNWVPGNVMHGRVEAEEPWSLVPANPRIGDAYTESVAFHSPEPTYEGHQGRDNCHLPPEGTCYWDESYMAAEPVLEAFLAHGPMAVWACLARHYQEMFGGTA